MCDSLFSRVLLFVIPWTVIPWTSACQASPLSMEFLLRHTWKRQEEHASICIVNTLCSWKNKNSETELISYRNVNMYRFWDLFFFPLGGGVLLFPSLLFLLFLSLLPCLSHSFSSAYDVVFFSTKQMAFVSFFLSSQASVISLFMCAQVFIPHKQLHYKCHVSTK